MYHVYVKYVSVFHHITKLLNMGVTQMLYLELKSKFNSLDKL